MVKVNMTVSELRMALEKLEKEGLGDEIVMAYDVYEFDVNPLKGIRVLRDRKFKVMIEYYS